MRKKKNLIGLLSSLTLIGALGGITVYASVPFGTSASPEETVVAESQAREILDSYDLKLDGEFHFYESVSVAGAEVAGYVSMWDNGEDIHLLTPSALQDYGFKSPIFDAVVVHEYAHIVQKRLAEQRCGANGASRFICMNELDALLKSYMSDETEHTASAFVGLETGADCVLAEIDPRLFKNYQRESCSQEQKAASQLMLEGTWPSVALASTRATEIPSGEKRFGHLNNPKFVKFFGAKLQRST